MIEIPYSFDFSIGTNTILCPKEKTRHSVSPNCTSCEYFIKTGFRVTAGSAQTDKYVVCNYQPKLL